MNFEGLKDAFIARCSSLLQETLKPDADNTAFTPRVPATSSAVDSIPLTSTGSSLSVCEEGGDDHSEHLTHRTRNHNHTPQNTLIPDSSFVMDESTLTNTLAVISNTLLTSLNSNDDDVSKSNTVTNNDCLNDPQNVARHNSSSDHSIFKEVGSGGSLNCNGYGRHTPNQSDRSGRGLVDFGSNFAGLSALLSGAASTSASSSFAAIISSLTAAAATANITAATSTTTTAATGTNGSCSEGAGGHNNNGISSDGGLNCHMGNGSGGKGLKSNDDGKSNSNGSSNGPNANNGNSRNCNDSNNINISNILESDHHQPHVPLSNAAVSDPNRFMNQPNHMRRDSHIDAVPNNHSNSSTGDNNHNQSDNYNRNYVVTNSNSNSDTTARMPTINAHTTTTGQTVIMLSNNDGSRDGVSNPLMPSLQVLSQRDGTTSGPVPPQQLDPNFASVSGLNRHSGNKEQTTANGSGNYDHSNNNISNNTTTTNTDNSNANRSRMIISSDNNNENNTNAYTDLEKGSISENMATNTNNNSNNNNNNNNYHHPHHQQDYRGNHLASTSSSSAFVGEPRRLNLSLSPMYSASLVGRGGEEGSFCAQFDGSGAALGSLNAGLGHWT
uniref:Uncharacterized protein n=1 Tax=Polytomella parva TaxID=51329 RepID=A0A7S0UJI3_9CHLO|mmetsp:Transcript_11450/g.20673  ORF Transcript_11450/g.20673 Transcript_11450/m.20673 type:complete len:611 (+) Transcript_11450:154-1986(+)